MSNANFQSLEDQLAKELLNFWLESEEQDSIEQPDRRGRPRAKFPYMQLLGPMRGECPPPENDLRQVRCQDISASGFAYYDIAPPESNSLVVGFGTWPAVLYVKAEVVHITPTEYEGEPMYKVGCRYTEKMTLEQKQAFEEKVLLENRISI